MAFSAGRPRKSSVASIVSVSSAHTTETTHSHSGKKLKQTVAKLSKGSDTSADHEISTIFDYISHDQGRITKQDLYTLYNKHPNQLALTSTVLEQGIQQFLKLAYPERDLDSQNNNSITEAEFFHGYHKIIEMLMNHECGEEILSEIEGFSLDIAGKNPVAFGELINLPKVFTTTEIEDLMNEVRKKKCSNSS
jgi:hypothetical protein